MPPLAKPPACNGCSLYQIGGGFSYPEGKGLNRVLVSAEALGEHEKQDGLPLRPKGASGAIFERAIKRLGFDREQFVVTNQLQCQPPRNELVGTPYERSALDHCRVHFDATVSRYSPRVILALGNTPSSNLTGLSGTKLGVLSIRGFAIDSNRYDGITVVPTYHPAFIARGKSAHLSAFMRDILYATKIAKGGVVRPTNDYVEAPPREFAEAFVQRCIDSPHLPIFHDVETVDSLATEDESEVETVSTVITQIQFTLGYDGQSIVFPWADPYIEIAKRILALPNDKVSWNGWKFDNLRYRDHGVVLNGVDHDLMWAWHHFQPDLPRGLQYAVGYCVEGALPWKHLSMSNPGFYGGCDTNYLSYAAKFIFSQLDSLGLRNSYDRHVVKLIKVLDNIADRGVPIDEAQRLVFKDKLEISAETKLQAMQSLVPEDLYNTKQKEGLKRDPNDTTGMVQREFKIEEDITKPCPDCVEFPGKTIKDRKVVSKPSETTIQEIHQVPCECVVEDGKPDPHCYCKGKGRRNTIRYIKLSFVRCPRCKGSAEIATGKTQTVTVTRWCRLVPFSPSSDQLLRYIKHKGHPVPTKLDDPEKETTGKDEIKKLYKKTKDPLYKLVLDYREIEKIKGTYVEGWAPAEDGSVHTSYSFSPATGQLAANNPNVLTTPKRGSLGKEFRFLISAKPGKVIIERDYTAAHALTLGFEAKDPLYMNVARNDIHGFVTLFATRKPECDRAIELAQLGTKDSLAELKSIIKHYRRTEEMFDKIRNFQSKPSILGIGFKMGVEKLFNMNRAEDNDEGLGFKNKREAQQFKDLLMKIFPKIFTFQDEQCKKAWKQGRLISRWGYIRRFFDVYKYDFRKEAMTQGEEAEACVAFEPANDAFGAIKEVMLRMEETGENEKFGLINPVHDALVYHCPWEFAEECIHRTQVEMERPLPALVNETAPGGLVIGSEVNIGFNLGHMLEPDKKGFILTGFDHYFNHLIESVQPEPLIRLAA